MKNTKLFSITLFLTLFLSSNLLAQHHQRREHHQRRHGRDVLKIVTSFSDYATIAEFIVQDNGAVDYIASGQEDPHFVPPKPSFAMKLRDADMWVTTGMDLEMWAPTLLDKARNKKIMDGEIGFVAVSDGVNILEKVEKADRTEGDIHLMGNPHITTGPLNWKIIADNLTIGLRKVDPDNSDFYIEQRDKFKDKVDRALFGDKLVDMFGGETLCKLLENKTLFTFLEKEYGDGKHVPFILEDPPSHVIEAPQESAYTRDDEEVTEGGAHEIGEACEEAGQGDVPILLHSLDDRPHREGEEQERHVLRVYLAGLDYQFEVEREDRGGDESLLRAIEIPGRPEDHGQPQQADQQGCELRDGVCGAEEGVEHAQVGGE